MTGVKNVPILYLEFNIKKMSFTKIPKFKITYRVVFWHFQLDPKMVNLVINIFIIFIAEIFFYRNAETILHSVYTMCWSKYVFWVSLKCK